MHCFCPAFPSHVASFRELLAVCYRGSLRPSFVQYEYSMDGDETLKKCSSFWDKISCCSVYCLGSASADRPSYRTEHSSLFLQSTQFDHPSSLIRSYIAVGSRLIGVGGSGSPSEEESRTSFS